MNAYELADELLRDNTQLTVTSAYMLRQQADRIAELEKLLEHSFGSDCREMRYIQEIENKDARIAELEKDFAWAKDQWNKDRICFESRRNELEKDLALKTRDRDVFSNFTLAYEDRIAELEKGGCGNCHACLVGVMENGYPVTMQRMIVCPDCGNKRCPKASNHRHQCTDSNEPNQRGSIYTTPQTKPLSDEEIEEIAKQHLAAYAQFIGAGEVCYEGEIEFARAIEERHGIK